MVKIFADGFSTKKDAIGTMEISLYLYKITYKSTAAKYVVTGTSDKQKIKEMFHDDRCDGIVSIDLVHLGSQETNRQSQGMLRCNNLNQIRILWKLDAYINLKNYRMRYKYH